MKKTIFTFALMLVATMFVGCGNGTTPATDSTDSICDTIKDSTCVDTLVGDSVVVDSVK